MFMLRTVLVVGALFAADNALAQSTLPPADAIPLPAQMPVYDTALAPGWENWSWAKVELSIEVNGSTRRPIRVEAGPHQALYLHHAPFSTKGMTKLSLLIQGSAPDGEVRVFALIDGKVANEGRPVKVGNTGWTKVVTPLATLGVEDKTIDGIWVQNARDADLPKFYVTEIKID
jgi:hypothetical protein